MPEADTLAEGMLLKIPEWQVLNKKQDSIELLYQMKGFIPLPVVFQPRIQMDIDPGYGGKKRYIFSSCGFPSDVDGSH